MRVALVSRELYPYTGGGIAPIISATARALAEVAEVTVVTTAAGREEHVRLHAAADQRVLPERIRIAWVEEPEGEWGDWFSFMHLYSARVHAKLREIYGERGPDLIEFCDYLAEGFVTVQDRHTRAPWLDDTLVAVRLHTTAEICAVLDGHLPDDFAAVAVHEAERYVLRHADRVLWSGGDVLAAYERYYGAGALAEAVKLPDGFLVERDPGDLRDGSPVDGEPLRLLYLGRAERRKGVQNLLRAFGRIERDDIELALLGGDTDTGPLGRSLRAQLELMAGGDPRIRFLDPVRRDEVSAVIRAAHVVVVPSLWECWPNVAREALLHNRPVLATPVGGLTELVVPGRSGWLAEDTSPRAIAEAIERLAATRDEIAALIEEGRPRQRLAELADPGRLREGYRALVSGRAPAPRPSPSRAPLVSVVVPYFALEELVEETLRSARAQTHPAVELLLVNDGSLREADAPVFDLAEDLGVAVLTQPNRGLGPARNFGIAAARGRYVLPLDADDLLEPEFLERCVHALERDRDLAYVTTYVRYLEHDGTPVDDELVGYMPYGNWSRLLERNNVGGTCASVFRRAPFERGYRYSPDLTSYEDWFLYRELAAGGYHGAVVPERLFKYRIRPRSMMRDLGAPLLARYEGEVRAHAREAAVRWTALA